MQVALSCACASLGGTLAGALAHRWATGLVGAGVPGARAACLCCAAGWASALWRLGPTIEALELCALCVVLVTVSLTDLAARVIPDPCTACAAAIRLAHVALVALWAPSEGLLLLGGSVVGAAVAFLPLLAVTLALDGRLGGEGMGGGDLKLFAVAGLHVGWRAFLLLLPVACALGIAFALVRERLTGEGDRTFPFGPPIALSFWATLLAQPHVEAWLAAWLF
ncbi:MAG: A24 family peptidase [Acidobacteriota bacterium]|nr:A24 family peptidase [Acidobacteriota bacterium]